MFFGYAIFEPPKRYKNQRKTALLKCGVSFGGGLLALIEQKTNKNILI